VTAVIPSTPLSMVFSTITSGFAAGLYHISRQRCP
jgi:hypothetical protein